jgi:hypothetical protein
LRSTWCSDGAGLPTSYLPGYAKAKEGLLVTAFANRKIMSGATYVWRSQDPQAKALTWLPGEGLNAFVVQHDTKARTVHMKELTDLLNVSEKTGAAIMRYPIG